MGIDYQTEDPCACDTPLVGYRALSADEMYKHALRPDGPRSLTDRFGFSILFVNDQSTTSREFLREYGVDLCLRTSDRVRFAFFSGAGRAEVARNSNREIRSVGLIRRVMYAITGNVNAEVPDWTRLRPDGLVPLQNISEIKQALSLECNADPPLPGAEEAMRFAHRLGIGAHVPCIVAFSDFGESDVRVLPIGHLSLHETFTHVRAWIDNFYSSNREEIDRWGRVEEEIEHLAKQARFTLHSVQKWRENRLQKWRTLQQISSAIRLLEVGDDLDLRSIVQKSRSYADPTLVASLSGLRDSVQFVDNVPNYRSLLQNAESAFTSRCSLHDIEHALGACKYKLPAELVPGNIDEAIWLIRGVKFRPNGEIKKWWAEAHANFPLSNSRHSQLRAAWRSLASEKKLYARNERTELLRNLGDASIRDTSTEIAQNLSRWLAERLGIDLTAGDATSVAVENFGNAINDYVSKAIEIMPNWIVHIDPPLTLREALPLGEDIYSDPLKDDGHERLRVAAEFRDRQLDSIRAEVVKHTCELVSEDLQCSVRAIANVSDIYKLARENSLTLLQPLRRRLSDESIALGNDVPQTRQGPPTEVLSQLHNALDDYDRALRKISLPYKLDPLTIPITPSKYSSYIFGAKGGESDAKDQLGRQLNSVESAKRLHHDLTDTKGLDDLAEAPMYRLKQSFSDDLVSLAAQVAISRLDLSLCPRDAEILFEALSADELELAAHTVGCQPTIESLLIALGFYALSDTERYPTRLVQHVGTDDFDVFMAHNSQDRLDVLSIANRLRSRGIYPWIDIENMRPGTWVQDSLQTALSRCRSAAVFIGPHGIGKWEMAELRTLITRCVELTLPLIPVLLPQVNSIPPDLLFLGELEFVHFMRDVNDESALSKLMWGITGVKPD